MLEQAWAEFCDRLKAAGDLVFRDPAPSTPLERSAGFQYLARNISFGLDVGLEHSDPLFPQLFRVFTPTRKWGGDNPDCLYLSARIAGEHTYRVVGNRGTVHFVSFSVLRQTQDVKPGGSSQIGLLLGHELRTEWDGSFQIILGPERQPGNWIPTAPDAHELLIRQFFGDWEHEEPMTLRIERTGADGPPPAPTPERLAVGLRGASEFLTANTALWRDWQERYRARPNTFISSATQKMFGATPGGTILHCYWQVQPDEALLIEFTPPKHFYYWEFELNDYWMCSIDYRYHLSSVNSKQAVMEEDGSVRVVVAHSDPGVPNWMGTDGHCEGHIGLRWMQCDETPTPAARIVKLADLPAILPASAHRFTPAERSEQLRRRKIGVDRRFRT